MILAKWHARSRERACHALCKSNKQRGAQRATEGCCELLLRLPIIALALQLQPLAIFVNEPLLEMQCARAELAVCGGFWWWFFLYF